MVEGSRSRCLVISEGDSVCGAPSSSGRQSFRGFNPATERLQAEAQGLPSAAGEGVVVSDAEMAER
jgi:hypothetical protein